MVVIIISDSDTNGKIKGDEGAFEWQKGWRIMEISYELFLKSNVKIIWEDAQPKAQEDQSCDMFWEQDRNGNNLQTMLLSD